MRRLTDGREAENKCDRDDADRDEHNSAHLVQVTTRPSPMENLT
jgi:hypothetical protein